VSALRGWVYNKHPSSPNNANCFEATTSHDIFIMGFLVVFFFFWIFFQFYVKHDLRKNKIIVPFFCQQINFYEF
jgi:hypothetical protein